jgi:hypothetical protein
VKLKLKKRGSAETFFLILSIVDWKSKSILAADGSPLETKKTIRFRRYNSFYNPV